jgi:hypothetical protein
VLRHLHDSIGFKSFHLHWVPHLLTDDLREKWKEHARAMLPFLYAAEHDGWHHLVTGDESWFFFNTSPRRMWILSKDDVVTKSRLDIQSKKSCFQSYGIRAASMLSTDSQMISKWTAPTLWQIYLLYSIKQSFLDKERCIKSDWLFISIIVQFTQVGFQQIGSKNMTYAARHSHHIHLI